MSALGLIVTAVAMLCGIAAAVAVVRRPYRTIRSLRQEIADLRIGRQTMAANIARLNRLLAANSPSDR